MRKFLLPCAAFILGIPVAAQTPTIFDISDVVVGTQRTPTLYFFAVGWWSDADEHVGAQSTEIQCYKALGFCDVASADWDGADAAVNLTTFDILRWNDQEIVAVDSSPVCVVNTLRADLSTKRVTLSTSDKGMSGNPVCKMAEKLPTAFLLSDKDFIKARIEGLKHKK